MSLERCWRSRPSYGGAEGLDCLSSFADSHPSEPDPLVSLAPRRRAPTLDGRIAVFEQGRARRQPAGDRDGEARGRAARGRRAWIGRRPVESGA